MKTRENEQERVASGVGSTSPNGECQSDNVGNRTAMTDTTGVTSYAYDAADRLQSAGSITFTWDANGNMKTRVTPGGTISHAYDYANRLTQVLTGTNTYQYAYDGDGIRVKKAVNGANTDYLWDAALGLPVILTDTNTPYLYGLGLIAQQSGVDTAYYHPDGLGTIRNLTNSSGQVIVGYEYDAFGGLRSSSGTLTNDFRFTGQQSDAETGLYYLRARYYDPGTGRFIMRDPYPAINAEPRTLNRYVYVHNNPVNLVDPTGLAPSGPPPVPVPWADPGTGWKWNPDPRNERGGTWGPGRRVNVPGGKGSQPSASWDPDGHWDVDDGTPRGRQRYDDQGRPLSKDQAHRSSGNVPCEYIAGGLAVAGGAYIAYRAVRFLPSLIPALWWTIPANAAIP